MFMTKGIDDTVNYMSRIHQNQSISIPIKNSGIEAGSSRQAEKTDIL